ncbi:hypothetical protein ACFFKU_04465 [Kineococcus gynurae]|uniref:Uncharacterized protein n=1 Tax=Kineococcus gynurae TaxID=452979 RepID=A0ABV5LRG5_9ACTN
MRARTGLAAVLALLIGLLGAVPAGAAWLGNRARSSGAVTVAVWDGVFIPVSSSLLSGAQGGDAYATGSIALGATAILDLKNRGNVPVLLSGQLASGAVVNVGYVLEACSVAWVADRCPTGASLRGVSSGNLPLVGTTRTVDFTAGTPLAPGQSLYLRLAFTGVLLAGASLTCVETPARAPRDRTLA